MIETGCDMATFAIITKAALVNIVLAVAGNAIGSQFGGVARFCVAGRADQAPVLPRKREARRHIMIELPILPAIDCMAA